MTTPQRIHVQGVQRRPGRRRSHITRWTVDGTAFAWGHETRAAGADMAAGLRRAVRDGVPFDPISGLPSTWDGATTSGTVAEWAVEWLRRQWDDVEPRTRRSYGEALARLIAGTVTRGPVPANADTVRWLQASCGGGDPDPEVAALLERRSMRLSDLTPARAAEAAELVRRRLDSGHVSASTQPLGAATAGRHRKNINMCLEAAAAEGRIRQNPWPRPRRAQRKRDRPARTLVDPDDLPAFEDAAAAIGQMANHRPSSRTYQLLAAVILYAGLRPSEAVILERADLDLPETGWGRIRVRQAATGETGWAAEDEETGDPKTGGRDVPIPPPLVQILRRYLDEWAPEPGPVFRAAARRGADGEDRAPGLPTPSNHRRALRRVLPDAYPYLLRHVHATMLARTVPLGEAARRLGHSVETLTTTYIGVFEGDEEAANAAIDEVLATVPPPAAEA